MQILVYVSGFSVWFWPLGSGRMYVSEICTDSQRYIILKTWWQFELCCDFSTGCNKWFGKSRASLLSGLWSLPDLMHANIFPLVREEEKSKTIILQGCHKTEEWFRIRISYLIIKGCWAHGMCHCFTPQELSPNAKRSGWERSTMNFEFYMCCFPKENLVLQYLQHLRNLRCIRFRSSHQSEQTEKI